MSVLLIEGDQTSQLPLPYLSVTKHLLTPSINHCSHLQCSHCSSQRRNNCSSRSNPLLSIFPSQLSKLTTPNTLSLCCWKNIFQIYFPNIICWLFLCSCQIFCIPLPSFFHPRHLPSDQYAAPWIHWIQIHHSNFVQHCTLIVTLCNTSSGAMPNQTS